MSFEINPVLAGKFDAPDNTAATNVNAPADTDNVTGPDSRRYTQYDRTITDAGTATMSFGDFLDMINPLQHIPVVSSVYRSVTGEEINPVSRVVGDIIYGGALGIGSAVLGGVGAVADTELASSTGKDSSGIVISALFGDDDDKQPVQLASAGTTAPGAAPGTATSASQKIEVAQAATAQPAQAAMQIPANAPADAAPAQSAPMANGLTLNTHSSDPLPPQADPVAQVAEAAVPPTAASAPPSAGSAASPASAAPASSTGSIPLLASAKGTAPGSKQAFGGVMAPPNQALPQTAQAAAAAAQPNLQAQDMAMALAQGAPSMRLGHMIYTNPLMNGRHPLPPMLSSGNGSPPPAPTIPSPPFAPASPTSFTSSSAASPVPGIDLANTTPFAGLAAAGMSVKPQLNQTSPSLLQSDMLKAISQYQNVAAGPSASAARVNVTN